MAPLEGGANAVPARAVASASAAVAVDAVSSEAIASLAIGSVQVVSSSALLVALHGGGCLLALGDGTPGVLEGDCDAARRAVGLKDTDSASGDVMAMATSAQPGGGSGARKLAQALGEELPLGLSRNAERRWLLSYHAAAEAAHDQWSAQPEGMQCSLA